MPRYLELPPHACSLQGSYKARRGITWRKHIVHQPMVILCPAEANDWGGIDEPGQRTNSITTPRHQLKQYDFQGCHCQGPVALVASLPVSDKLGSFGVVGIVNQAKDRPGFDRLRGERMKTRRQRISLEAQAYSLIMRTSGLVPCTSFTFFHSGPRFRLGLQPACVKST